MAGNYIKPHISFLTHIVRACDLICCSCDAILTSTLREVGHILVRPLLPHIVVQRVNQASKPAAAHDGHFGLRERGWQRRAEELDRLHGFVELRVDHFVVSFKQRVSYVVEGVVEIGSVV